MENQTEIHTPHAPGSALLKLILWAIIFAILSACTLNDDPEPEEAISENVDVNTIENTFGDNLQLTNLFNYENQRVPNYIRDDNSGSNAISNKVATLGRVLFYDKSLSTDNSVSCASCHQQTFAFGDQDIVSQGVNGVTGRHSMRLVNARFANESMFFWDERANTLEEQTTMPIQDHNEMGFSGGDNLGIDDLITKMEGIDYLVELFEFAFDDTEITETRIQTALSQFVRSIQSFDTRYDQGRAQVNRIEDNFSNFTAQENLGKALFVTTAGCARCHQGDEFDIDPASLNNGVIGMANDPSGIDTDVTRAPTLRDLFNGNGELNGPLMHDGSFATLEDAIAHYTNIQPNQQNNNLDPRLLGPPPGAPGPPPPGGLMLTTDEVNALVAFVKTLSGSDVYTNEKWSDPFN